MIYTYIGVGVILGIFTFVVARQTYIYRAMSPEIYHIMYIMVIIIAILYSVGGIFLFL